MKIHETCSCTASITVEDADIREVTAAHLDWVGRHECDGNHPWAENRTSTTGGQFGFSYQRPVWDPFKATAGPTQLGGTA